MFRSTALLSFIDPPRSISWGETQNHHHRRPQHATSRFSSLRAGSSLHAGSSSGAPLLWSCQDLLNSSFPSPFPSHLWHCVCIDVGLYHSASSVAHPGTVREIFPCVFPQPSPLAALTYWCAHSSFRHFAHPLVSHIFTLPTPHQCDGSWVLQSLRSLLQRSLCVVARCAFVSYNLLSLLCFGRKNSVSCVTESDLVEKAFCTGVHSLQMPWPCQRQFSSPHT
eukprot:GGOE01012909.1.p1 GENE.GGOE01012909.1~~GGOE01012909.1.p1  ORF type:complete len:223 (-),score=10.74 GGOE01012909.1:233-901(-)